MMYFAYELSRSGNTHSAAAKESYTTYTLLPKLEIHPDGCIQTYTSLVSYYSQLSLCLKATYYF